MRTHRSQLRVERVVRGLTILEVMLEIGLSETRISRVERGVPATPDEAALLSGVYEMNVDELFADLADGQMVALPAAAATPKPRIATLAGR